MPRYEYRCQKCNQQFEQDQSLAEHARKRPACPSCKTDQSVEPVLSTFYARTSRKA